MGGLLKFLLITICILYVLRILARIFLPFLFKRAMNKMQEKMQKQYGGQADYQYQHNNRQQNSREGEISVEYTPQPKKKPNLDKGGEFVDFEEVK